MGFLLKKLNFKDLSYFSIGIILLALGIRIIGISNLGLAFSDAIPIKLAEIFKISVSISSVIFGIILVIIASIIKQKKVPEFGSLITSFVLGLFVDIWFFLIPSFQVDGLIIKIIIFIIGAFVLSIGVSMYLQPNYPPHPIDLLLMALVNKYKTSIFMSKIFIDIMFAAFAIIISAPIGIGSIFNTFCLGFFTNKGFYFFKKIYDKKSN